MRHYEHARVLPDRTELLRHMPVKGGVTCEVGVAFGDFSKQILEICRPSLHIMIDSWSYAGRYDDAAFKAVCKEFASELNSGRVKIIRAQSIEGLLQLEDGSLDFLYIDTDHSYKTTKAELELGGQKIKDSGIIAGHDYKAQGRYDEEKKVLVRYGVVEAVQEFMDKADYDMLFLTNELDGHLSFALRKHSPD